MEKLTDGTTECLLVQEREIAIAIKRERKVWTVDGESAEYSLLNTSGDDYDPNAFSTTLSIPASFFSQQKLEVLRIIKFHKRLLSLPREIGKLKSLRVLECSHNGLLLVPQEIGELQNLVALHLFDNNIAGIPEAICHLPSLKELVVSGNRMNSLPDSIGCLTALTTLSVAANQLTFLPTSFTALGSLNLSMNRFNSLPEELTTSSLTSLRALNIGVNRLQHIPEADILAKIGPGTLKELCLAYNELQSISSDSFLLMHTLEVLDLRGNFTLSERETEALTNLQKSRPHLKLLL